MVQTIDRYLSNLVSESPFRSPNRLAEQVIEEVAPADLEAWLRNKQEILLVCYFAMTREDLIVRHAETSSSNVYRFPQRVS